MRIGGFRLPSLGNIAKSVLSNVTQSLKKTAGSFFKSGFEAAKKTLFAEIGKMLGIKPPSAALAQKSPSVAASASGGRTAAWSPGSATCRSISLSCGPMTFRSSAPKERSIWESPAATWSAKRVWS